MLTSRVALWFLPGVVAGLVVGTAVPKESLPRSSPLATIIQERIAASGTTPVSCGADVDTEGWNTFENSELAYELRYPPNYVAEQKGETLTVRPASGEKEGTITLEKFRSTIGKEVDRDWRLASWKVADRKTFALTSAYFTENDNTLWSQYLFVRDFPFAGSGPAPMVRATLISPLSAQEYRDAQNNGQVDFENILTLPERILSTFRFYQNEELLYKK